MRAKKKYILGTNIAVTRLPSEPEVFFLVRMGMIDEIRTHPVRFVKNCGLFSCFLTIGLSLGVVGPTLLDFASKTKSDLKLVALILPFRAGGYAAGSFVSGLLYNKIDVQVLGVIVMAISGAFTIAIPFITDIWVLLSAFLVVGTNLGLFSAGNSRKSSFILFH